jgi:hypothetical protein
VLADDGCEAAEPRVALRLIRPRALDSSGEGDPDPLASRRLDGGIDYP